ncbi:DELTA-sagatoxin-Srs1a-like [Cyprinodon tularosa]|uniref:DELTA-sagatoxin-Srs1a-like n=1 Tax=Cyprinodon tularosa TaxID=77115 RepID=UPI0018E217B8|nr:DELTA-sagatoxin-Srs1a-like [Cyprinodon tularosa]
MSLSTHCQCTVEIQNKTSSVILSEPLIHLFSGNCESPLPPTLRPSESGTALFIKKTHAACGSVAVFTYDIVQASTKHNQGRLAVMFSNPYDFNMYSNWYAIGAFSKDKRCDEELYKEMYYGQQLGFVRGKVKGPSLTNKVGRLTIRASMSDSYQPVLKVELCNN